MSAKRNIVIAGSAAAAIAAGVFLFLAGSDTPRNAALAARQRSMQLLGAEIAKRKPDCKILVLSNPFSQKAGYLDEKAQFERIGLRGLRKGLGNRPSVAVSFPAIRPEYLANPQSVAMPPDSRTPLSFLVLPSSVDQLAADHPECNVVVSLIGLPTGVSSLKVWDEKDPRAFALLLPDLRVVGSPEEVLEAFQRGKILAVITDDPRSGAPVIVTRENAGEILKSHPKALGF